MRSPQNHRAVKLFAASAALVQPIEVSHEDRLREPEPNIAACASHSGRIRNRLRNWSRERSTHDALHKDVGGTSDTGDQPAREAILEYSVMEASAGIDTDVWAEGAASPPGVAQLCDSTFNSGDQAAPRQQSRADEKVLVSLQKFLQCVKSVQGSVAEDMQELSREIAAHSVGVTSATSFAELQHHITELVHLSGPEVSSTTRTDKKWC